MSLEARRSALEVQRMILRKFAPELMAEILAENEKSMANVAATIARQAPVSEDKDPGQLRDSVHSLTKGNKVLVVAGGNTAPHALHVEFGTRKMRAVPFFYTTWRLMRKRVLAGPRRALSRVVKKYSA